MCVYCVLIHAGFFSAWLEGEEDPIIERVNQRIEDVTDLTVQTAELLQVMYLILHSIHLTHSR